MFRFSPYALLAILFVACGVETDNTRPHAPISDDVADPKHSQAEVTTEKPAFDDKALEAPEKIYARVALSDLESEDFSLAEFIPVRSKGTLQAKEIEGAFGLLSQEDLGADGEFLFLQLGDYPAAQEGFGLCGGDCGSCSSGCGGYARIQPIRGLLRGVGRIIGGIIYGVGAIVRAVGQTIVGIGSIFTGHRPWFNWGGRWCGYQYSGFQDIGDYRYFEYDRGEYFPPGTTPGVDNPFYYPVPASSSGQVPTNGPVVRQLPGPGGTIPPNQVENPFNYEPGPVF